MSINRIYNELWDNNNRFVSKDELTECSNKYYYQVKNVIQFLKAQNFMVKFFGNVYYLKSPKEKIAPQQDFGFNELLGILGKVFEIKRINNWYFGLNTALYLNRNSTDKIEDIFIVCDKIPCNKKLIKFQDFSLKFIRLNDEFFKTGIIKNGFNYSDYEKTILDFILMWTASQKNNFKIIGDVKKLIKEASIPKLQQYALQYPVLIQSIIKQCLDESKS